MYFNTFAAKPLKKPISQCEACFIDLIIIYLFYYLPYYYILKISACSISLERDFIAEYSAYQVNPTESLDTAPLKPGTYPTTRVVDGSER